MKVLGVELGGLTLAEKRKHWNAENYRRNRKKILAKKKEQHERKRQARRR